MITSSTIARNRPTAEAKEGFKRSDGPTFQLVETVDWRDLQRAGGFTARSSPLLVKGPVKNWSAWRNWSFENLSCLRRHDGSEIVFRFQNGLVEQGVTRPPLDLPVGPYLRDLATEAGDPISEDAGLMSASRLRTTKPGDAFHLDWSYMNSFQANKVYLAQWDILREFPNMKRDFAIRELWNGLRWTWEFVFIGPKHTVTGLHFDFPNNWFCQVRGTKEVMLFDPSQSPLMSQSKKYDWGATLSDIDISRWSEQRELFEKFSNAHGRYARVEAGDALFIPRGHWHSVVALEPSVSLAVFGLTPAEIIFRGGRSEFWALLHKLGLYANNRCTCHKMTSP